MTPDALIALVASAYGLTQADLVGRSRRKYVVGARQVAAWMLRRAYPDLTLSEIGHLLGHRDHTTMIYSIQQVDARIASDPILRAQLHSLLPQQPSTSYRRPRRNDHAMRWWVAQSRDAFFVRAA
jgi:chromosomal replication initiator protein